MNNTLLNRTKKFGLDCWFLCSKLPKTREYNAYVNQLIRCSSSVGANYRASQRAKSSADFINKLKIVEEETDESQFFLELILCANENNQLNTIITQLIQESEELLSITVASIKTARKNNNK